MSGDFGKTKYACYTVSASMSVVANLSPLLFLTFRNLYGFSFSMLGALVLINFCTQIIVDLIFSFYSHRFNMARMVKLTPVLTASGLFLYAVIPLLFPGIAYVGLVIGTVVFSISGGLAEVLLSPVIAALPSDNPGREVSKLHSVNAWGLVFVVILSTLLLFLIGRENWPWLAIFWMALPLFSSYLFSKSKIPPLKSPEKTSKVLSMVRQKGFVICFLCIFFGGATECTMAQWSSGYIEQALNIPKIWGDIFGVALFAAMLGLGRTLYSKFGKNIYKVLAVSAFGSTLCYIMAAFTAIPVLGLLACGITGLCSAMLWTGSLIVAAEKFPSAGVAIFALMAAAGDLGGALGPQLVGTVADIAVASKGIGGFAASLGMGIEQLAMKIGPLSSVIFPLFATLLFMNLFIKNRRAAKSAQGFEAVSIANK